MDMVFSKDVVGNLVQLKCIWITTCVNLVTLLVVNVSDNSHINVLLVVKVNILTKPTLVLPFVQMVPMKMKNLTNVSLVTILVKLVSDQNSTIVILVKTLI